MLHSEILKLYYLTWDISYNLFVISVKCWKILQNLEILGSGQEGIEIFFHFRMTSQFSVHVKCFNALASFLGRKSLNTTQCNRLKRWNLDFWTFFFQISSSWYHLPNQENTQTWKKACNNGHYLLKSWFSPQNSVPSLFFWHNLSSTWSDMLSS